MSKAQNATREHTISGFFIFCLIGVFAVLLATLTLFGVRAYSSVHEASTVNSEGQIAISYLQNKVHSGDSSGNVAITSEGGVQLLILHETLDGEAYETRIYYHDGSLCECFCRADEPFDPALGSPLTELESFDIQAVEPWLIRVTLKQRGGGEQAAHIALRSGEVAAR